jgi:hypothetical protein
MASSASSNCCYEESLCWEASRVTRRSSRASISELIDRSTDIAQYVYSTSAFLLLQENIGRASTLSLPNALGLETSQQTTVVILAGLRSDWLSSRTVVATT